MRKFVGFAVAGGSATLVNFSVFLVLLSLQFPVIVASAIGYVSGIFVSFWINNKFVFSASHKPSLLRYGIVYLVALGLQLMILNGLILLQFEPILSNGIAILIVLIANFFVMRHVVFNSR